MDSYMAQFGARLVDNGYPVLPIIPGTKKPGQFTRGAWHDYPNWDKHGARETTEHEINVWSGWPDAGIGIATGLTVGIDIDVMDGEAAHQIEQLARAMLGDTPAVRFGQLPKRMLVYRAAEPFPGIKEHPLEILATGQQLVAFHVHPLTGKPYEWPNESPAAVALSDLPAVTEEQARAFLVEAHKLVPQELRQGKGRSNGHDGRRPRQVPAEYLHQLGEVIPNDDLPWDEWNTAALAFWAASGGAEDGLEVFDAWCKKSSKCSHRGTAARRWAEITRSPPGRVSWRYLLNLARDVQTDFPEPEEPNPAQELLDRLTATTCARAPERPHVDPAFLEVDGALKALVDHITETARRPQPLLALGASLCAVGALAGRKYRTESNLRSNLYVVGIVASGGGKNRAREAINELFVEARLAQYLGGHKIASGAGLLTALHRQPAILFQIDEFGMFMSAAADRRHSPRHVVEILENMTELYTAAGGIFLGAEYANRDGKNERRDIQQPCLCVYGTTTPPHFWGALQSTNVIDGSLARFVILQPDEDYPDENLDSGTHRTPEGLLESLQLIAAAGGREYDGNLVGASSDPAIVTDPVTVPMKPEARAAFVSLSRDTTRRLRELADTKFAAIVARIAENAAKVALVRAVSRDPVAPAIQGLDAEWAISLVSDFGERMIRSVDEHVSDNVVEANHKKVLSIIRAAGGQGLTKNELTRRCQFLEARQRAEILVTLIDAGLVDLGMRQSKTKPAVVYFATDAAAP